MTIKVSASVAATQSRTITGSKLLESSKAKEMPLNVSVDAGTPKGEINGATFLSAVESPYVRAIVMSKGRTAFTNKLSVSYGSSNMF